MLDKALNYVFSEDPDFQGFLQTPQAKKVGRSNYVWLHGVVVGSHTPMDRHIFTELVGIQMLLMNTLEPLLRGDKLAQEQLSVLFRQVQTTKAAKAQELLAKRSQNKEK